MTAAPAASNVETANAARTTLVPPDGDKPAGPDRARPLDYLASLSAFRAVLDSLARPGTICRLPDCSVPAVFVPVLALADVEVRVAVAEAEPLWGPVLCRVTGARPAAWPDADLVVAMTEPSRSEVLALRRGSPQTPEGGARLCIACDGLAVHPPSAWAFQTLSPARRWVHVRLSGPGVSGPAGTVDVGIEGLSAQVFKAIADANAQFPCGIDTHLVAPDGAVVSLPRTTRVELIGVC